jgi:tRNA G37 N-methylase Trm5
MPQTIFIVRGVAGGYEQLEYEVVAYFDRFSAEEHIKLARKWVEEHPYPEEYDECLDSTLQNPYDSRDTPRNYTIYGTVVWFVAETELFCHIDEMQEHVGLVGSPTT